MAKITRYTGNLQAFAVSASVSERTIFGSTTISDDLDDNINADFKTGWEIISANDFPPKQYFNAIAFTVSQILSYIHQMGVPEWVTLQEYYIGSIATYNGIQYTSKTNANIGNIPLGDSVNWKAIAYYEEISDAVNINYDNATSGLSATDVKGALDELSESENIVYDPVATGLGADVQAAIDALYIASVIPSGAVQYFAMATAPTGWLEADGSAVLRATYSGLFSALGTLYGIGDGTTTFNIPDLRGQFIRGYDNGAGVDTGRVFGSGQDDALEEHSHYTGIGIQSGELLGYAGAGSTSNALSMIRRAGGQETSPSYNAITSGVIDSGIAVIGAKLGATSNANTPADETRPANLAMLPCIKI